MTIIRRFSPFSEIDTLHRQMNRLFDEITTWDNINPEVIKPAIELIDNENSLTLRAKIAGVNKKDLDITVTREQVKISGEYRHNHENKDKGYYVSEFNYGKFERIVSLPVAVQNDQVSANYTDGILTLILPKVEEVKNKVFKVSLDDSKQSALEAEVKQQNNQDNNQ